ncbi:hypothetical protein BBF93_17820 [Hyphomonas sp. CACIAM 19H1]|uniref:GGDEF domain-containing protein n=1 Tax=Hyphomonas sp. CACIAM 19H1 TaxID=1873716 RepID=UPI000DEDABBA|nr:GGDEF domain-containing protein [Hyphomonas sp. CACIAM 19H1]AXE65888.1 hypothetical protein BBF93_17820 [Hyphomonas sp. CACIAM 19H1]
MQLAQDIRRALQAGALITAASIFFSFVPVYIWLQIDPVIDRPSIYLSCIILPLIIAPACSWFVLKAQLKAQRLAAENYRLANIDDLTNLPNRRAFFAEASVLQMEADGGAGVFFCAIADVDNFKRINDSLGHEAGDDVLISVAGVLRALHPPGGLVARLGGEEFAVAGIFVDMGQARAAFEAMVRAVASAGHGVSRPVTVSLGFAGAGARESLSTLLSRADEALYRAKQAGKNRALAYEDGPVTWAARAS